MVLFDSLKTGDKIARRKIEFINGELIRNHYPAKVVRSVVTNTVSGVRSVELVDGTEEYGHWLHDLQFTTIQDELNRYDKVS
jgi:hypothetical protein